MSRVNKLVYYNCYFAKVPSSKIEWTNDPKRVEWGPECGSSLNGLNHLPFHTKIWANGLKMGIY